MGGILAAILYVIGSELRHSQCRYYYTNYHYGYPNKEKNIANQTISAEQEAKQLAKHNYTKSAGSYLDCCSKFSEVTTSTG